ncbi:MAG: electron transfer flavoprotein subunit beta/FixA family protein [bacterium]|nr:electron transfer flavoprotein subunit beta/FixA family protein [bacterium]
MNILVCIKQVADMESRFVVPPGGSWFEETDLAFRINEYDEYAIEAAVQVKEKLGDAASLTVLSLGPQRSSEALKKALAMGADQAIHLLDPQGPQKDSLQVARAIHSAVKDKGFELIFTGMQSQDRGSAQVGILLAELLGIDSVSTLVEFSFEGGKIQGERELEGGIRAQVTLATPALVTCQLGLNQPRYPTLPNIMKAKKKPMETLEVSGTGEAVLGVKEIGAPPKRGAAELIEGDLSAQVAQVVAILKDNKLIG